MKELLEEACLYQYPWHDGDNLTELSNCQMLCQWLFWHWIICSRDTFLFGSFLPLDILLLKKGNKRKVGSPIKQTGITLCPFNKTFSHFGISPFLNFLFTEEFKNILEL